MAGTARAKELIMTRYRIHQDASAICVELTEAGGQEAELLRAFEECRSGHCTCPTSEYQKLASMQVQHDAEHISLRLQAKPGTRLDASQIAVCLDHTVTKLDR